MGYYNRYSEFIENGDFIIVPTIVLDENTSDKEVLYKVGRSRMDKISQQFYGVPYYGWLIMLANPSYGGQEWKHTRWYYVTSTIPINSITRGI